jgi:hypothetical protein
MSFPAWAVAVIFGGYGLAVLLLFVAARTTGTPTRIALSSAGLLTGTATVCLLTYGTFSGPWMWMWALLPVVLGAWLWLRRYLQSEWMDRLAGKTGRVYSSDRPGRPSFGVLTGYGRAVSHDDPRGGFDAAVEIDYQGHRIAGVQYRADTGAKSRPVPKNVDVQQVIDAVDSTHGLVELACPATPALLIKPRLLSEQQATQSRKSTVFEDLRITRNTIGALTPDVELRPVTDGWEPDFAANFHVHAEDEAFARAVLTPEVQRLFVEEPWFRIRLVACHRGALWTNDNGQLAKWLVLNNAYHLAQLAAAIPAQAWRSAAPADEVDSFLARARGYDPGKRPERSFVEVVNERRGSAGRVPLGPTSLGLRTTFVLLLAVLGVALFFAPSDSGVDLGAMAFCFLVGAAVLSKVTYFPGRKSAPGAHTDNAASRTLRR